MSDRGGRKFGTTREPRKGVEREVDKICKWSVNPVQTSRSPVLIMCKVRTGERRLENPIVRGHRTEFESFRFSVI